MHQTIRDFCHKQGIRRFHDVGDHGIVHQLIAERGYAHPWDLVIGSDSHTNMVGAAGAFAAANGGNETVGELYDDPLGPPGAAQPPAETSGATRGSTRPQDAHPAAAVGT